jgi:hypothetical protein
MQSFVCLSVAMSRLHASTAQQVQNHMSTRTKGKRPERKLEAQEKRAALSISFYIGIN